jgi:hypothetical protein
MSNNMSFERPSEKTPGEIMKGNVDVLNKVIKEQQRFTPEIDADQFSVDVWIDKRTGEFKERYPRGEAENFEDTRLYLERRVIDSQTHHVIVKIEGPMQDSQPNLSPEASTLLDQLVEYLSILQSPKQTQ